MVRAQNNQHNFTSVNYINQVGYHTPPAAHQGNSLYLVQQ